MIALLIICFLTDIVIQILGIGKCEWDEKTRTYHDEEIYFKNEIKISEPTQGVYLSIERERKMINVSEVVSFNVPKVQRNYW